MKFIRYLIMGGLTVGVSIVSACAEKSGILGTAVGREMQNSDETTPALVLGDAVFTTVKGMSFMNAKLLLEADGAICLQNSCTWSFIDRETWYEMTFGTRMPGPRRISKVTWSVSFAGNPILSRDQVTPDLFVEPVSAKK